MATLSSFYYYYYYGDVLQDGDYTYVVTDGKAEITAYTGAGGNVTIPGILGGLPVTNIGDWAFSAHTGITSIAIPEGVTCIGYGAFSHCYGLINISIPEGVTSIGSYAFYNCNGLTNITLLQGVNTIGTGAFECCTGLVSFTIPEGVTSIGDRAFQYCTGLTNITIPEGVTNIGYGAFCRCTDLTSISIPQTVTSIGFWAFSECTGLINIIVAGNNQNYASVDGVLFNKEGNILVACPGGLTSISIPQTVTIIGAGAFDYCKSLTSISIPEGVTSIDNYAFEGCEGLTSISIPEGVTSIGYAAFAGCYGLTSISIPQTVTSIGDEAFSWCQGLTDIIVAVDNLNYASIDGVLFNKTGTILMACPGGLTDISIPHGVTSIGNYAFEGCRGLTNISIPQGVTSIRDNAFQYCTSLTSITIPESLAYIGNEAFLRCSKLTSITITQGVIRIGDEAFYDCSGLSSIIFNSASTEIYDSAYTIPDTTTIIGYNPSIAKDYAATYGRTFEFLGSPPDYTYTITDGKAEITKYNGAGGVVAIPDTFSGFPVTSIGSEAFWDCSSITSITIPQGVTSIGDFAFYNCYNLISTNIPHNVTSIGDSAFGNCQKLTSISIPASVTRIGVSPFGSGFCLSVITVETSNPKYTSENGVLFNKAKTELIQCPGAKSGSYTIPSSVTSIGRGAFAFCHNLTSIVIPDSVVGIGRSAFTLCWSLSSINIPNSVTSIGEGAFIDDNLMAAYFYGNAPDMGDNVFDNSKSDFTVYYLADKTGFTNPWNGYKTATFIPNNSTTEGCFIATAAFGSKFYWPVALLRQFRDQYLLTNSLGTAFVKFYYQNSPPIAAIIATSQPLKILVRVLLAPVITGVYLIYHPALLVAFLFLFIALFAVRRSRLRRRCV